MHYPYLLRLRLWVRRSLLLYGGQASSSSALGRSVAKRTGPTLRCAKRHHPKDRNSKFIAHFPPPSLGQPTPVMSRQQAQPVSRPSRRSALARDWPRRALSRGSRECEGYRLGRPKGGHGAVCRDARSTEASLAPFQFCKASDKCSYWLASNSSTFVSKSEILDSKSSILSRAD